MFRLTLPSPHLSPFPCRVSVSPHTAHQIVRQYLLHYGYGDTLGAFDAEAGFRAEEEAAGQGGEGGAAEGAAAARHNGVGQPEGEDGGPCRCVCGGAYVHFRFTDFHPLAILLILRTVPCLGNVACV